MACFAGLKAAVLWTLALTALSLVAVAGFSLLSWAQVPALIGLLYIGVGVVAAPVCFIVGGMCTDSHGLGSKSYDLLGMFSAGALYYFLSHLLWRDACCALRFVMC